MTPEAVAVINAAQEYVAAERRLNNKHINGTAVQGSHSLIQAVEQAYQSLARAVDALHERAVMA